MARAAEEVGFDSIWLGDHLLYDEPERAPWEAWTLLSALAAVTERVTLGPLVACAGFHPPGLLAKMAATIDEVSGGRFVLGLGAGWNRREFDAFGIPYDRRVVALRGGVRDHPRAAGRRAGDVRGRLPPRRRRRPAAAAGAPHAADDRLQRPAHAGASTLPHVRRLEHLVRRLRQHRRGLRGAQRSHHRGGARRRPRPGQIARSACVLVRLDGPAERTPEVPPSRALRSGSPPACANWARRAPTRSIARRQPDHRALDPSARCGCRAYLIEV